MSSMRFVASVVAGVAVVAAWPHPDMSPMIDACKEQESLSNCTSMMKGTCKTDGNGERSCAKSCHKSSGHGFVNKLLSFTKKMGYHAPDKDGEYHHHGWPQQIGDCGSKADHEECTLPRNGQCVSSGRCPLFKGEMVCYPIDAHPPSFVTASCNGKKDGDDCKQWLIPGKCTRPVPLADLFCKAQWAYHMAEEAKSPVITV